MRETEKGPCELQFACHSLKRERERVIDTKDDERERAVKERERE